MKSPATPRYLGAVLILVVGIVHLQQYASFIKDVPTVGTLFILNAAGAGALVAMLALPRLRVLAALGGIGLCAGSLVSIVISMNGSGFFGYTEPTWRGPIVVAVVAEILAILALAALALGARRGSRGDSGGRGARRRRAAPPEQTQRDWNAQPS